MVSRYAEGRSCTPPASGLVPEEVAQEEHQVGGPLGQATHEIGKPIAAVWNINAEAVAVFNELPLQVGSHAVKHLELKIVLGDFLGRREANRLRDHARVVGGYGVIKAAGQQHLHQADVIAIDVFLSGVSDLIGFLVSAFTKANAAAVGQQVLNILFAAVQVGLDHRSHGGIARANTLDEGDRALRVIGALHVDSQKIVVASGTLDNRQEQALTEIGAEIEAE